MKNKLAIFSLLFFFWTAFTPFDKGKNEVVEEKINKSFSAAGITGLDIDNFSGTVDIIPANSNKIEIEAVKRAQGRIRDLGEKLKDIDIIMEPVGKTLRIRSYLPEMERRGRIQMRNFSLSTHFRIKVPARLSVEVRNKFGTVAVSGINSVTVDNNSGGLNISEIGGDANLTCSFNSARISDIKGNLTVENKSGGVRAERISGMVRIDASFNTVRVMDAKKDVFISNSSGAVDAIKIEGNCEIENSFNTVTAESITGNLVIRSQSSGANVMDIGGVIDITTSFNTVDVYNTKGGRINNKSGGVTAKEIKGDLYIESSFNTVTLDKIYGKCEVNTQSASVNLTNIQGDALVKTSFNTVKLIDISGRADVTNQSGSVYMENIQKDAFVSSSFNPVEAYNIKGDLEINNSSGRIEVNGAKSLRAVTTFNPVNIENISGPVYVNNQSGSITADLNFNPDAVYDMETSFGDIRLTFTGPITAKFDARVSQFGKMDIDVKGLRMSRFSKTHYRGDIVDEKGSKVQSTARINLNVKSSGNIYMRQR